MWETYEQMLWVTGIGVGIHGKIGKKNEVSVVWLCSVDIEFEKEKSFRSLRSRVDWKW